MSYFCLKYFLFSYKDIEMTGRKKKIGYNSKNKNKNN